MSIYMHMGKALAIILKEPDLRKWGPLIDALTPEEQAEVRPWLRQQAKIAQRRLRDSQASPMPTSSIPFGKVRK